GRGGGGDRHAHAARHRAQAVVERARAVGEGAREGNPGAGGDRIRGGYEAGDHGCGQHVYGRGLGDAVRGGVGDRELIGGGRGRADGHTYAAADRTHPIVHRTVAVAEVREQVRAAQAGGDGDRAGREAHDRGRRHDRHGHAAAGRVAERVGDGERVGG